VAKSSGAPKRKRFSRSGHTAHNPNPGYPPGPVGYVPPPPPAGATQPYPPVGPPPYQPYPNSAAAPPYPQQPPGPPLPHQVTQPLGPAQYDPPQGPPPFGQPTYHHIGPPSARMGPPGPPAEPASPAVAVTKAAISGTNRAARAVTRKVIDASKADGAHQSGLTALIWNQVLSYGTDAMITVALAGTVFFGASAHAQRGNVLLYLLVTMAPFAVVAPFIGPALDQFQHGRRWTMAGTAAGRAVLALIMAGHPTDLFVLYPCALGSLVLSKAYGVVRAAAAPRLVPEGMTLTEANARMSMFGLASTLVLGGFVGIVIKTSGSYTLGLVITAIGFTACAYFAFRLPPQVDSVPPAEARARRIRRAHGTPAGPLSARLLAWARQGYSDTLIVAMQGEIAERFLSGMLTIFMAFFVESTAHGVSAAAQLGAVVGATGIGNACGTAIGTRIKITRPELVILADVCLAAVTCVLAALLFNIAVAVVAIFVSSFTNALSKIALDSMIQREVPESLRSSGFARSETFLQLGWVVGATLGVVLPARRPAEGPLGFWVAAAVVGGVALLMALRMRALRHATAHSSAASTWPAHPGSVGPPDHGPAQ
jgi:hypothetical protein